MQISFKPGTVQESDSKCLLHANRLKSDPKKAELILIGSKVQLSKCDMNMVNVCNNNVVRSKVVQYLGAWHDENMNFNHDAIMKC